MSKRVEVRAGDEFRIAPVGNVWQFRDGRRRCVVCHGVLRCSEWLESFADTWPTMPLAAARAWIESLGGEWAEVAEEKAATTRTKTLHVYQYHNGKKIVMHTNRDDQRPGLYLGTTTITIAGVT
jgi:hypothetical protein